MVVEKICTTVKCGSNDSGCKKHSITDQTKIAGGVLNVLSHLQSSPDTRHSSTILNQLYLVLQVMSSSQSQCNS